MARQRQDHYFRQARREGYRSRAAYKLIEIDDRRGLFKPGDRVLDCGAAPGSWLQVASSRVGPKGFVVGIDLRPLDAGFPMNNVRVVQGDFLEMPARALLDALDEADAGRDAPATLRRFDVILSDMAPNTSGSRTIDHHQSVRLCHGVLDRCPDLLRPGGRLAVKVFEGEAYPQLLRRAAAMFEAAKGFTPKASRAASTEIYLLATGFTGAAAPEESPPGDDAGESAPPPPAAPAPRPGWSES